MSVEIDDHDDSNLDIILTEVGEFGQYQVITFLLICIPTILAASNTVNYMISANSLDYRCKVPGCDFGENNREIQFNQPWLKFAIPIQNGRFDNCFRFAPKNETKFQPDQCSEDMFDTSVKIACTEFIYESDETNLQTEFNIHCSESYKLALVGTVSNVGGIVFLPLNGFLSDRFGRLKIFIFGMLSASIFGIIKSYSVNFSMYLALEALGVVGSTCTFATLYVLCIELVNSKYRVLGSTMMATSFAIGEVLLGVVAMYVHDYRPLIRILQIPGLFMFLYFWLVPESVRWLLINGRTDRAVKTLKRIASINRKELSSKSIEMMNLRYTTALIPKDETVKTNGSKKKLKNQSFFAMFKSKILLLRFVVCSYQWIACFFCYFGLSLNSTHVSGADRYLSFIIIMAIEIPSNILYLPLVNHMKRRTLMFATYSLAGLSIIVTPFIPEGNSTATMICFLLGKATMTGAAALLFIFTAEQWPTSFRTTVISTCSMIGSIGSMVAPFTVILDASYHALPALLFGSSAIFAAIFVVFNPETFGKKLPDTIEEAEQL